MHTPVVPLGMYRHQTHTAGLDDAQCAAYYEAMPHHPHSFEVELAYLHFRHETTRQYVDLIDSGWRFTWHHGEEEYTSSTAMFADLHEKKLAVRLTSTDFGAILDHPMLTPVGSGLLLNDTFRAVHDVLGHGGSGGEFGPIGEREAWKAHRTHYSYPALPALWCETRGQAAWTNQHLTLPLKDRPFAVQKAGTVPRDFL